MKTAIGIIAIIILIGAGYMLLNTESTETIVLSPQEEKMETDVLEEQVGLPPKVEATRQVIYAAALSRDFDALASLATHPNFSYSFGGPYPGGFAEYLKISESRGPESPFDIIIKLLHLPYAKSGAIYAWPGIFYKNPEQWTEEDVAHMKTFLTEKQVEDFRQFGGYLYYRVGIDEAGNWIFYIAGD